MATGTGQQRDKSQGTKNQPDGKVSHSDMSGAGGSPHIQGTWSRKHNSGGTVGGRMNSKKVSPA